MRTSGSKPKVAEGQIPAFFHEGVEKARVELPYAGPGVDREEIEHRAGTRLDHRWTHKVEGSARRGRHPVLGLLDESQRVFQTGGELSAFVYWRRKLVTLPMETWRLVNLRADWIEVVDHERNECWRISTNRLRRNAVIYEAGIGERIGAPMDLWDVITAAGTIRQEGRK